MHLDIDDSSLVRQPAVRRHLELEIARRLGGFAGRIDTIRVRLRERAPSEPTRTMCGMAVSLEPRDGAPGACVLARAEDDDACRAVDRTIQRVATSLGEEFTRRDREQALRARTLRVFTQAGVVQRV